MARFCSVLAALLALAAAVPAQAKPVTIRWHGQSFFEVISPEGVRIVLDPHAIEAYGRNEVQADLVLMTHFHTDHTRTDVVTNLKEARQINALKKLDREGTRQDWNVVDEKLKDVRVRTVGTYHDDATGLQRGKNGIFVLDVGGLRVVHLGDLGHLLNPTQIRKIGPVDVLMIPVGGTYTINGLDAQKVVEQLKPRRYIIPMHYGTPVYDYLLNLNQSGFLDDQTMGTVKRYAGNELTVDPNEDPPREPIIAILHWEKRGSRP
jgi:L-ascorbate metabolism protein UlaG (beta-lactamase superfamily)